MRTYSFDDFKKTFDEKMLEFGRVISAFHWEEKESYAKWCAHTYYYVRHSTRLLAYGAARADLDQPTVHRRFVEHLGEEKGHEKLVLADMKQLGVLLADYREMPETSLFYQNQYYWLMSHGPIPFFGWILALEGAAAHTSKAVYERVKKAHGASAAVFLKLHSEEDEGHLEKALESVKGFSANELQQTTKNFEQSCELYFSALRRINSESTRELKTA
ncbi:iron-containing redox enzyme family protein [soil metagenome]